MTKDFFDILDVSLREDTYTSLIVEVLNTSQPILKGLVHELIGKELSFCLLRPVAFREPIQDGSERPDIIIKGVTDQGEHWIVIEAKIKSKEGEKQCERYRKRLDEKKDRENPQKRFFDFDLFFLTLTGEWAEDPHWKPLTHKTLADVLSKYDGDRILEKDPVLAPLWKVFAQRLHHHDSFLPQSLDIPMLGWLNDAKNEYFITAEDRCKKLAKVMIPPLWHYKAGIFQARGGPKCLIKIWKPSWITEFYIDSGTVPLENCISIHYELASYYPCKPGGFSCRLHCETNPYMKKETLYSLGVAAERYLMFADEFKRILHGNIDGTGWKPSNNWLEKAKLTCYVNERTTIAEFAKNLQPHFDKCCDVVTSAMIDAAKKCHLSWWKKIQGNMNS
ncbi:MAG: PD-(D/E)XK nuclease family protein [Phycisphaerae bacterium]